MFTLNDDLSIYVNLGDAVFFSVTADDNGKPYVFQAGDVVRIKVYGKKDAENVVLQKDFPVMAATESVDIYLTEDDTKIDDVISKHKDYWYEVELNPFTNPTTIIGYDEDGAKVFRLFPEGDDIPPRVPVKPEDIPIVDDELDMTSTRPVENQAIARAIVAMQAELDETQMEYAEKMADTNAMVAGVSADVVVERARIDNFVSGATAGDEAEVIDGRVSNRGYIHGTIGGHIRDVNDQLDERFENLTIEGYEIGNLFKDIKEECEMIAGRFFRCPDSNMAESVLWNCYTYPVRAGERYRIRTYTVSAGAAVAFMAMEWNAAEIDPPIYYYPTTASAGEIVDVVVTVPPGAVQMLVNERTDESVASISKLVGKKFTKNESGSIKSVLNGKRLVCCGDSITEAVNPSGGYFANYAEIVADRHGMTCHKDGVGGSTMAYGNGKSFSISRYLNVPEFDYLTIWFGWNDAAYSKLGTIEDVGNDTFYGAYKMVLEHLVTNNPTKKIGIIVPYGSDAVDPFAQAVREVSALYGVPCLDLKDNNRCSLLWGTKNAVQLARRNALTYDGTHPNQAGYDYLSTMYEQFLLSL